MENVHANGGVPGASTSTGFSVGKNLQISVGKNQLKGNQIVSEYEVLRQKRIHENKQRLKSLGVTETVDAISRAARKKRLAKRSKRVERTNGDGPAEMDTASAPEAPARRSKRLREADEAKEHADFAQLDEGLEEVRRPKKRSRLLNFNDHELSSLQVATPFTLLSEKVTVIELGSVWRGEYAHHYWSSTGCKYHHAYPVGYRATKVVFGKTYEMSIEEGEAGPAFCVQDTVTGKEWRGDSPTNPWTAICIHQNTGQRISGPKFFGFSDLFTLKALAKNLYNEEELAAAVSGAVTFNEKMTDEELAAKKFSDEINGVGPKLGEILARFDVTGGGGKPKSLSELAAWCRASHDNRRKLYAFLTTNENIPATTRAWPTWFKTIAHRVVDNISQYRNE